MHWIPFHAAYALHWEGKAFWEGIASVSSAMNGWPGVPLKVSSVIDVSDSLDLKIITIIVVVEVIITMMIMIMTIIIMMIIIMIMRHCPIVKT